VLPIFLITSVDPFEKCSINFLFPVNVLLRGMGVHYIITSMHYLIRWVKCKSIKNCIAETTTQFIFENVITRFECLKVLMSDQGSCFLNKTIWELTQEFMIHHQKINIYHPQANGTIESFNNILEHALAKVCNV